MHGLDCYSLKEKGKAGVLVRPGRILSWSSNYIYLRYMSRSVVKSTHSDQTEFAPNPGSVGLSRTVANSMALEVTIAVWRKLPGILNLEYIGLLTKLPPSGS